MLRPDLHPTSGAPSAPTHAGCIRVALIDDHPVVRLGLQALLDSEPDIAVCLEAESAEEALAALPDAHCQVAVIDISLPGMSGLDLVKTLQQRHPQIRTLVMSMHDESLYAERVLRAGGSGYLMKQGAPRQVVAAVRRVHAGQLHVSEALQSALLGRVVRTAPPAAPEQAPADPLAQLSDRELEVFRLVGRGLRKGEIARQLRRSVHTVESHRASIKRKLGLQSAADLARLAHTYLDQIG